VQIDVTKENVEWAKSEKRIFLKQSLETRLIGLYYENRNFREALPLINDLLKELKKLDDKMILTEVHLLESKVNHAISNFPKAKVSADVRWTLALARADNRTSHFRPPSPQHEQRPMPSTALR
jgi:26S proteasome regulatory subunit RPN6 N-terminal domain